MPTKKRGLTPGSDLAQLNIASLSGKNIHDLWEHTVSLKAGDTAARVVTIPFADFSHHTRYADSPDFRPVIVPSDGGEPTMSMHSVGLHSLASARYTRG